MSTGRERFQFRVGQGVGQARAVLQGDHAIVFRRDHECGQFDGAKFAAHVEGAAGEEIGVGCFWSGSQRVFAGLAREKRP